MGGVTGEQLGKGMKILGPDNILSTLLQGIGWRLLGFFMLKVSLQLIDTFLR